METVPCPIHPGCVAEPFLTVPDRFSPEGSPEWRLVRDPGCGLVYLSPRPAEEEMHTHYPESGYDPHLSSGNGKNLRARLYLALRRIALGWKSSLIESCATRLSPSSRILEIGCSDGGLLGTLMKRNRIPAANCLGYEKDVRSATRAKENFGFEIQTADICDIPPPGSFELIILWHTLEHLHRLNETLAIVASHLGQDGVAVIALPNAGSLDAGLYEKNWIAWDAPRHLYHFTPDTLAKLLGRHGLAITTLRPFLPDTLYNCLCSEELEHRASGGLQAFFQVRGLIRALRCIGAGRRDTARSSTLVYTVRKGEA